MKKCVVLLLAALAVFPATAQARAYYVDADNGRDGNAGSLSAPWQSLVKVSQTTFQPGDRILLHAGGVWNGQIFPKGSGTESRWITLDRYGRGPKPRIHSDTDAEPIRLDGQSYWTIQNLAASGGSRGVLIGSNGVSRPQSLHGLHLRNLDIAESTGGPTGEHAGIHFVLSTASIDDVLIADCRLDHVNATGIWLQNFDENARLATNVVIRGNTIDGTHDNGIVVNKCENPRIEDNTVYRCGAVQPDPTGAQYNAGIFPFKCHNGMVQRNEVAYTARSGDGQGLDLDEGCSGVFVYQRNYSHDNWGGFFEDTSNSLNGPNDRCLLRYNISVNDGAGDSATGGSTAHGTGKNAWGLFRITGRHLTVYNNVFYSDRTPLYVQQWYNVNGAAEFVNNIFWCPKGFRSEANDTLNGPNPFAFDHNLFYGSRGPAGGARQWDNTDPRFVRPGAGGAGFRALVGYRLRPGSPCLRAGRWLPDNGGRDFFGVPLPLGPPDIGAAQSAGP